MTFEIRSDPTSARVHALCGFGLCRGVDAMTAASQKTIRAAVVQSYGPVAR
jgi:hypothetical protein